MTTAIVALAIVISGVVGYTAKEGVSETTLKDTYTFEIEARKKSVIWHIDEIEKKRQQLAKLQEKKNSLR